MRGSETCRSHWTILALLGSLVTVAHGQPQNFGGRGPGGPPSGFPPPPLLSALDKDNSGDLSKDEIAGAVAAIRRLDKNRDGQITDDELRPDFGRFPGGGRGGPQGRGDSGASSRTRLLPSQLDPRDGLAEIPDHATYHKLSYRGEEVMIDTFLANLEFVKFTLDQAGTQQQALYFINTKTHRAHMMFASAAGLPRGRGEAQMKGVLVYRPMLRSPNGEAGLYTFEFEPFDGYSFEMVKLCHDALIQKMPILAGRIGYYPRGDRASAQCLRDASKYENSDVPIYREEDLTNTDLAFLPLNPGTTYGTLRVMEIDERPNPRDVVLYRSLPNEMPRVAGIITDIRQTPLSHVNLRAVQDRVPNAFISGAASDSEIKPLIGKLVAYTVSVDGYRLREATTAEVQQHFAQRRPAQPQSPERDLSVREILPLAEVRFEHSVSVGVKAANLATLRTIALPDASVPNGHAVPFYFYDEFMRHNGFYHYVETLLENPEFQRDRDVQIAELKKLRVLIKKGKMPTWMTDALTRLHKSFPESQSIRCRSSTNNEDLPGFSGAGLYDSYTHHPDEGHFSKSIKQVYASLWNYRAFDEREFYRVDHLSAAMGVLVHPNYSNERVNGVAVTDDILYQTSGNYYVNSQAGEDLVTNPDEASIPEEILIDWWEGRKYQLMRQSNRATDRRELLSATQRDQLRDCLGKIHARFAKLYGKSLNEPEFAMEIEFKITKDNRLAIKQARPWVFAQGATDQ